MMAAVTGGMATSFCVNFLWVERDSVPGSCLPHHWLPTSGWLGAVACGLLASFQDCDVCLNCRPRRHIDAHGLTECVCSSVHGLQHLHD